MVYPAAAITILVFIIFSLAAARHEKKTIRFLPAIISGTIFIIAMASMLLYPLDWWLTFIPMLISLVSGLACISSLITVFICRTVVKQ